jgi:hypothetical protein
MKRYIAGILAVIIAVGAVAFTVPAKKIPNATFTFHYTLTSYGKTDVEANNNWTSGASLCGGVQNKACQMEVTDTYTHLDNNIRVLNTTGSVIVVKAVTGTGGTDYVPDPGTSTGIPSASDKE